MAEFKVTLNDGQTFIATFGVHNDPSNCGYKHLSNICIFSLADDGYISIDHRRVIYRLLLNQILLKYPTTKRFVMSAIVPKTSMYEPHSDKNLALTYHFIHDNRLCKSKSVMGNHADKYNQYTTVLSWFDHDQVSRITKRDQAIINSTVKEYKLNV